jgi:hypothetical protein
MEINVQITRKDYLSFSDYVLLRKTFKRYLKLFIISAIILPIIFSFGKPFLITDFLTDLLAIIISLGFLLLIVSTILFIVTRVQQLKDYKILGNRKYIINKEGIKTETENSNSFQKWANIKSIEQNKHLILIFINKYAAYIIPKRYFESQEQIDSFIKEVKGNLNQK